MILLRAGMTGRNDQAWLLQKRTFRGVGWDQNTATLLFLSYTYHGPRLGGQGWSPKTNLIDDCLRKQNKIKNTKTNETNLILVH